MADLSKYVTEAEIRDLLDSFFDDFPGNSRRLGTAAENTARMHAHVHACNWSSCICNAPEFGGES